MLARAIIAWGIGSAFGLASAGAGEPPEVRIQGPWLVSGRVTHGDGKPFGGATVEAFTGIGSLRRTASAITDSAGRYHLKLAPGTQITSAEWHNAAVIFVRAAGYYERNLCRHGDLGMASAASAVPKLWRETAVLPGEEATVDFQLLPALSLKGRLLDAAGQPMTRQQLTLTGGELPPASSVLASVQTDDKGQFEFRDIPSFDYFLTLFRPTQKDEIALLLVPRSGADRRVEVRYAEQADDKWNVTVEWLQAAP